MVNLLATFKRTHSDLQTVRLGFTLIKERWYSWNYWAQIHSLFSYDGWMRENKLKFHQVKAKARYPDADVIYDRETGYEYYEAWRGAQFALDQAEETFDLAFQKVWEARNPDGQHTYSNEQIGKAIGKDGEALRKFASKRTWYTPRKKGTK